jgi:hypothetical protein
LKVAGTMSMTNSRCQCLSSCSNPPLKGEAFCKKHLRHCPRIAPTNGYEPPYEPEIWNMPGLVKVYNCFAYAFNIRDTVQEEKCIKSKSCDLPFHQPGSIAGYPPISAKKEKTCPNIIARMMGDNKSLLPSAFELKCPRNMSKIALMVDPRQDYHFVRQNPPEKGNAIGYFSSKSGELPVTNLDADGHKIFDVELANFNYDNLKDTLKYTGFCGYFCVSRNKVYAAIGGSTKYRNTKKKSKTAKRHSRKISS